MEGQYFLHKTNKKTWIDASFLRLSFHKHTQQLRKGIFIIENFRLERKPVNIILRNFNKKYLQLLYTWDFFYLKDKITIRQ